VLVAVLLILRIPYLAGIRLLARPDYPLWLLPSEEALTYLATAALIYLNRYRLANHNFTLIGLGLFLVAPIIEPMAVESADLVALSPPDVALRLFQGIVAVGLSLSLFSRRRELRLGHDSPSAPLAGLAIGAVMGVSFAAYSTYEEFGRLIVTDPRLRPPAGVLYLVAQLLTRLRGAAIAEEPLFRGFLWGEMRAAGWRNSTIWIVQAALFWVGHIYYIGRAPFSFWVVVPAAGLAFGALAWRTRSVASSMMAHTLVNELAAFLLSRTFYWRFS